jgi:alpha-ribazole phosphatase
MTSLYLVRHGSTFLNHSKVYYGWTDVELSEEGHKQCLTVKEKLENIEFDVIICSTLERAVASAAIISSRSKEELILIEELKEFNFGAWETMNYKEIEEKHKDAWEKWCNDWINFIVPQGESFYQFYERVNKAISTILKKYKDKKILLVCHEGTLKVISTVLLNMKLEDYWRFTFEFGKYSVFEIQDEFSVIKKINC